MKITFVQSDDEYEESQRVIRAGLSLKKARKGAWILPPARSKQGNKFVVVDSDGKDVFVESFDTIDGALAYALRIHDADEREMFDKSDFLAKRGYFI